MARRRMISEELIIDEEFNLLSIEAQNVFIRMLTKSDDCGVVPAGLYVLTHLINPPEKINLESCLVEIIKHNLGDVIEFEGKPYFIFKPDAFDTHQRFLLGKRTKSEYLRVEYDSFQEILGTSKKLFQNGVLQVISNKKKVTSRKKQVAPKKFIPPTKEQVIEFFKEHRYTVESAVRAFNHYNLADWHDAHGKPVKNWKQKMNTNWFKTENKEQEENPAWK